MPRDRNSIEEASELIETYLSDCNLVYEKHLADTGSIYLKVYSRLGYHLQIRISDHPPRKKKRINTVGKSHVSIMASLRRARGVCDMIARGRFRGFFGLQYRYQTSLDFEDRD